MDAGFGGDALADARGIDQWASLEPVSYTHLDVYKRQALDLAPELIKVAKLHRLESGVAVDYRLQSVEALAAEQPGSFDAITCMEMLEHVPDPSAIIAACASLLKPGGQLFLSTLNRTPAAFALAIVGAEYVARLLPKGTHQYQDFILSLIHI